MGHFFFVYSVMNKRDQYHLALHPHSIENKIKQLELKGEQQSLKVRQLLYRPTSPRPSDRQSHFSPLPQSSRSPRREHPPQTLKKTQLQNQINYQEVASIRQRIQRQLSERQQKVPLPTLVEFNANRDQDQQMQYLKSQEYKKYLDSLTKATSKQERVRLIKENRNHNVYMGKGTNLERRIYNGEVSRRMARQNLESARNEHSYERSPMKIWERDHLREKNGREQVRDRRATEYQREGKNHLDDEYFANDNVKRDTKQTREVDQDYIRSVYEYFESTISPKSNYPNENPSIPSSNRNHLKKNVEQYFPKPPISQSKHKPEKQLQKKQKIIEQITSKDFPVNILTSNASNIYKQEVEFCKKRNSKNEKTNKTKRQAKQKHGYTYRIIEDDKENFDSKSEQSTPRLSNQSKPNKENIYDISFKIQKPNQAISSNKKQNYYKAAPQVAVKRDHSAKIVKKYTKMTQYENFEKYEEKHNQCTISPLQTSQARSTTTKTDCASKSSKKISVISRSKVRL